jgi:exodeoxyribonuclease VII large subunit
MKILLLGAVGFHEVYGLSLNIKDIDPAYTMGEMALKRRETIERLRREGILERNQALPLPLVPQRIAVISSPTAAGYGDFRNQLDSNPYGYRFTYALFPAIMQGSGAEESVTKALAMIARGKGRFDLVAVIRGGGSATDLSCFDAYGLAAAIAIFPIPVITGIGHEKDDTVTDLVAHTKLKTPTAVAEFLIAGARAFDERIARLEQNLRRSAGVIVTAAELRLAAVRRRLAAAPLSLMADSRSRLDSLAAGLRGAARHCMVRADASLVRLEQAIRHLDPANILKRGYSITRRYGKVIRDADTAPPGSTLITTVLRGTLRSIVEKEEA